MIWLTVACVVRDDPDGLSRSLASLATQDLSGVELVVIDGSSAENPTREVLTIIDPALPVTYLHQAPRGIYPAMNAAVDEAQGIYLYFLNAGDELADANVLAKVKQQLEHQQPVWAFGPVEIVDGSGRVTRTPDWDYSREAEGAFSRGYFPSHQGTFARTASVRASGGFDETYGIAADYALALSLSMQAPPVRLGFVIARFFEGGASTQEWQQSFREFRRARREFLNLSGFARIRSDAWHYVHWIKVFVYREVLSRRD